MLSRSQKKLHSPSFATTNEKSLVNRMSRDSHMGALDDQSTLSVILQCLIHILCVWLCTRRGVSGRSRARCGRTSNRA